MSIETLKLALKALESCTPGDYSTGHVIHPSYDENAVESSITALRQAIEQAEQPQFWEHNCLEDGMTGTAKGEACNSCGAVECRYPDCDYPCMNLPDCKDAEQAELKNRPGLALKLAMAEANDKRLDALKAEQAQPVSWKHDCAALLQNDVKLWVEACPHCGKPRTAPPPRQPEQAQAVEHCIWARNGNTPCPHTTLPRQPEQEPIGEVVKAGVIRWKDKYPSLGTKLYTAPPPRQPWVGLTNEDKQIAFDDTQEGGGFWEFADAIEATLRKKNHG